MNKSTVLKLLFPQQHTFKYIEYFYSLKQWKEANLEKILHFNFLSQTKEKK